MILPYSAYYCVLINMFWPIRIENSIALWYRPYKVMLKWFTFYYSITRILNQGLESQDIISIFINKLNELFSHIGQLINQPSLRTDVSTGQTSEYIRNFYFWYILTQEKFCHLFQTSALHSSEGEFTWRSGLFLPHFHWKFLILVMGYDRDLDLVTFQMAHFTKI